MPRTFSLAVVLASFALAGGCSKRSGLVPVDGRVTLDGKAVKDFVVTFNPLGETPGNGAHGYTDAEGRFTLTDVRGAVGAHAGEYAVSFYPGAKDLPEDDPLSAVTLPKSSSLPAIYIDPSQTPVRATVPAGGGTVEIQLTRSGKGAATKTIPKEKS